MKYRAEIDGLRALAVLPVIFFHAGFELFSGGFIGVDVFFVISGYLITSIIISEMAENKFSIINFYERRARRILPALFFVMAICLPFAWMWLVPNDLKDFGQSLIAVSTFSSNILFWLESGYFDTAAELKPLLHTWSLAVEEQYYILFPIFLIFAWRFGIKLIVILLSIFFLLSLGAAQWGAYNFPSASFYLLPTRGWELLIGVFAAFYLKYNRHLKSKYINQSLSLIGFCMIIYSIIIFDETTPFPSFHTLIPTIGTVLLILFAVPETYVHRLLSSKLIVGIGLISYSAYLWHQPLLAFANHRFIGDVSNITLIALCLLSLLMAWFSWKFVERPFRDRKKIDRKNIFILSGCFMVIFISIGLSIHVKNGFNNRFSSEVQPYFVMRSNSFKALNYECHLKGNDYVLKDCIFGDQSVEPKYALIGDSHAGAIHVQLDESFSSKNKSFFSYAKNGCPPSLRIDGTNNDQKNCPLFNSKVLDDLSKKEITTVVLFSRFSWYLEKDGFKNSFGVREQKDSEHFIVGSSKPIEDQVGEKLESMRDFIRELRKLNIRVLIIEPIPEVGWDVPQLKAKTLIFNLPMRGNERMLFEHTTRKRFKKLIDPFLDDNQVVIVSTSDIFCDNSKCYGEKDGNLLYWDDDHPSIYASKKIVERIQELEQE